MLDCSVKSKSTINFILVQNIKKNIRDSCSIGDILVRFPNPLATGHSWQLGNLTIPNLAQSVSVASCWFLSLKTEADSQHFNNKNDMTLAKRVLHSFDLSFSLSVSQTKCKMEMLEPSNTGTRHTGESAQG